MGFAMRANADGRAQVPYTYSHGVDRLPTEQLNSGQPLAASAPHWCLRRSASACSGLWSRPEAQPPPPRPRWSRTRQCPRRGRVRGTGYAAPDGEFRESRSMAMGDPAFDLRA